ncbi:MAG TPA: hypothetical protein PKH77_01585 [Anaerolineae bacterium]|nr:hypothetical protein [Anaerolineae bacterium]
MLNFFSDFAHWRERPYWDKKRRLWAAFLIAALWLILWHGGLAADEGDPLPPGTFAGPCATWTPVSDGGFGLPNSGGSKPYDGEEGFEVIEFAGRLYVGMEADNTLGARLWRTRAGVRVPAGQADWEEVAADVNGKPFGNTTYGQNDHIDSLAVFNGALYASTANQGELKLGTLIYSSTTGAANSWTRTITPGFGDINNTNFKDMAVFTVTNTAYLCGGTQNGTTGAQVWCTADGAAWTQRNLGGFGDISNTLIASSAVFNNALYFGTVNANGGQVWRTTNLTTWTQVFVSSDRSRVEIVGVFSGALTIAAGAYDGRNATDPTIRLYRSATGNWGAWNEVGVNIRQDLHNTRTIVDGGTSYNGAQYVAVMNYTTGVEVWRTTNGITWTQANADGFGDANTFAAQLTTFNGYLYAWTSNYYSGQRVLRAGCPIAQPQPVTGPGRLNFPGVGAVITLTEGAVNAITVSVLPGAPPTTQTSQLPLPRTYHLAVAPATAIFTADVTLSYTPAELTASSADSSTLYLARWDGATWEACPLAQRARDPLARTVTCRAVTAFSTWAIAGDGGEPSSLAPLPRVISWWPPEIILFLAGIGMAWLARTRKRGA